MFERQLNRASEVATEVVDATALHVRRIAGVVRTAAGRTGREVGDLVWDYNELAGSFRRSRKNRAAQTNDGTPRTYDDNVIFLEPRRRQAN
jgi:hypothetical protein